MELATEKRPTAALINKSWYESACRVLDRSELGALLVSAVEYVITGQVSGKMSGKVEIVFAMVQPALDSDIANYLDRCARNAANARAKRLAASGSESQPVDNNININNNINNNINIKENLSLPDEEQRERDLFLLSCYFFNKGAILPVDEAHRFYDYYDRQGWRSCKGAPITSKIAAARMWRLECEIVPSDEFRALWWRIFKEKHAYSTRIWSVFRSAGLDPDGAIVRLCLNGGKKSAEWLESDVMSDLRTFVAGAGGSGLSYVI